MKVSTIRDTQDSGCTHDTRYTIDKGNTRCTKRKENVTGKISHANKQSSHKKSSEEKRRREEEEWRKVRNQDAKSHKEYI